jgi:hypothetical protein
LADEPLAEPSDFVLAAEAPTVIVNVPKPERARPEPAAEPEPPTPPPPPPPDPAPTLIASARTVIGTMPELAVSSPAPKPGPALVFPEPRTPRPAAEARRSSRPSAADMAAVDALLNSRGFEGALEPLEKPVEPHRGPGRPERGRSGPNARSDQRSPLALVGLLLVAAAIGGGLWFFLMRPRGPAPVVASAPPATRPPVPATTLPVEPSPAPTAPPETLATQPSPTEPAPSGGKKSIEDARALLSRGSLAPAAEAFAANVRGARSAFSIQILVACSDDTVQKAIASVPAQGLFILPVHYKGKSCYRLCWGLYDAESRATSAVGTVPEYFRQGGANPKVVRTSAILP